MLGRGRVQLAGGQPGSITATLTALGQDHLEAGSYFRVTLRGGPDVHSGFTTFVRR